MAGLEIGGPGDTICSCSTRRSTSLATPDDNGIVIGNDTAVSTVHAVLDAWAADGSCVISHPATAPL